MIMITVSISSIHDISVQYSLKLMSNVCGIPCTSPGLHTNPYPTHR